MLQKTIYTGQKNPHRKGSKEFNQFNEQRDWWMNNLNLSIIRDYLQDLDYSISRLEMENNLLHKFRDEVTQ